MQITNIHQAKTHLSNLIQRVYSGEEVIICKSGKPMVKLIKYDCSKQPRIPGIWKGKVQIAEDFDDLPDMLASAFKGENE